MIAGLFLLFKAICTITVIIAAAALFIAVVLFAGEEDDR